MLKRMLLLSAMALLAGCGSGVEWLPDNQYPARDTINAGTFETSIRPVNAEHFTTTTSRGVFVTYTSLTVPAGTPVTWYRYRNTKTGTVVTQALQADPQTVLIWTVMSYR